MTAATFSATRKRATRKRLAAEGQVRASRPGHTSTLGHPATRQRSQRMAGFVFSGQFSGVSTPSAEGATSRSWSSGQSKSACWAPPGWWASISCRGCRVIRGSSRCGWRPASARRARPTPTPRRGGWRRRCPGDAAARIVARLRAGQRGPKIVFSGLDASVAGEIEGAFAAAGHVVVSNARNYRMDPLVPLLIPEVNADHLRVLAEQRTAKGWTGAIVTNPNCSTIVLASALAPLRQFGLRAVVVSARCRRCRAPAIPACRRSTSSATSCRSSAAKKRRCRARRRRFSAATAAGRRTRCGSAPTPTACR